MCYYNTYDKYDKSAAEIIFPPKILETLKKYESRVLPYAQLGEKITTNISEKLEHLGLGRHRAGLKFPKDSGGLHPHAGLNKGHYSCLTWEEAGEASGQPDKGRATGSRKETKGHICPIEELAGSLWWILVGLRLSPAPCLPEQCTEVWLVQRGKKMSIDL